jgi:hypothetical protein
VDGKVSSILVGHDDETWDFGVSMPETVVDEIMAEIERESDVRFSDGPS